MPTPNLTSLWTGPAARSAAGAGGDKSGRPGNPGLLFGNQIPEMQGLRVQNCLPGGGKTKLVFLGLGAVFCTDAAGSDPPGIGPGFRLVAE